jgi:hypothetical protein
MKNEKPEVSRTSILKSIESVLESDARQATVYQHPKLTIKTTRLLKLNKRSRHDTYVLTIGTPNYAERAFVKACLKAGEPFPIRKVQLKFYPEK